ncbi:MAG TPA: DUF58 domain-containing protein, partial [Chitinophagaceae bacterium]|nr:DUF58 domain-containing protein [Chitinophagaceae bacterium]
IINLFVTITCWFAASLLLISFISAFIPWIIFLNHKRNNRSYIKINTTGSRDISSKQIVEITISKIIRPLFGYIRLRLLYDEGYISTKFSLIAPRLNEPFFSARIHGTYNWPVKNIKEYEVKSAIIYFEDFFQFFSFTAPLDAKNNFYTYPLKTAVEKMAAQPKKTQDASVRIDEIRKVEGELLSYKNFEDNDDVRRIVWKIYAKNKDLVVRIPEVNDPYASHIYFYASFYDAISNDLYAEFNTVFLDNYKTIVWNLYEQLYRQNELTQYMPDQQTKAFYADDIIQKVRYIISTSSWQKENDLAGYFNNQVGSVLCISSLSDARQVEDIISKSGKNLTVIMVELSKSFSNNTVTDWLEWIFVNPSKKSSDTLQMAFNFSPLRKKISGNEKIIRKLLTGSGCEYMIFSPEKL